MSLDRQFLQYFPVWEACMSEQGWQESPADALHFKRSANDETHH